MHAYAWVKDGGSDRKQEWDCLYVYERQQLIAAGINYGTSLKLIKLGIENSSPLYGCRWEIEFLKVKKKLTIQKAQTIYILNSLLRTDSVLFAIRFCVKCILKY